MCVSVHGGGNAWLGACVAGRVCMAGSGGGVAGGHAWLAGARMACGGTHGLRGHAWLAGGGGSAPNPRSEYGSSYFKMLILRQPFGGPQILFDACSRQRLLIGGIGGSKGGREGRAPPPGGPNSFNFMQFFGKFGNFVCWRPPRGAGAPSSGKSWIRHWVAAFKKSIG